MCVCVCVLALNHICLDCVNTAPLRGAIDPELGSGRAIATRYEDLGGGVHRIGKSQAIQLALDICGAEKYPDKPCGSRTLVIGDSIPHDVLAAKLSGLKVALVPSGVHREQLRQSQEFIEPSLSLLNSRDFVFTSDKKSVTRMLAELQGDGPAAEGPWPDFFLPHFRW